MKKKLTRNQTQTMMTFGILIILCIVFAFSNPNFLTGQNLVSILLTSLVVGIIAIGECTCVMSGYFDMSVGMIASLAGLAAAATMKAGCPVIVAVGAGLCVGLVGGLLSGLCVSYLGMNAFITTFALQSVYRGIIYIFTDGFPIPMFDQAYAGFTKWGQMKVLGIQFPIIAMVILYVVVALFLKYRKLGRCIYLVGSNPKCAHICGINLHHVQMFVFVLCDVLAALAGMLYAARVGTANAFLADTICMEAIAATIVGGTSLAGGKGNLGMTFVGVLIVFVVKNGLIMIGLPDFYQYIAVGLIFFLAVLVQTERKKN